MINSKSKIRAIGQGLWGGISGLPAQFTVETNGERGRLDLFVAGPSEPKIDQKDNKDGSYDISYIPMSPGEYSVHILCDNEHIQFSPFRASIKPMSDTYFPGMAFVNPGELARNVQAYGRGLKEGMEGEIAAFTVKTVEDGGYGLKVVLKGSHPLDPSIYYTEGTYDVRYLPYKGELQIHISYFGKPIPNSPFKVKITPSDITTYGGEKKTYLVDTNNKIDVEVTEEEVLELTCSQMHSGREESCLLKRLSNGLLGVGLVAHTAGNYLLKVYRHGNLVHPPFEIDVDESKIASAYTVDAWGKGLVMGIVDEDNEFIVNIEDAGYGGLTVCINGPTKDFACSNDNNGESRVTYKVTEPGIYKVNILFADDHIRGSPFKVRIERPTEKDQQERPYRRLMLSLN